MIAFEYALRVTLLMRGSLRSNISEDFPIHIGPRLEESRATKRWKSAFASLVSRQAAAQTSRNLHQVEQSTRISMTSLAPSLPDYETATNQNKTINDKDKPPPSYSCPSLFSEV